jgi:hypothetical protein
VNWIRSAGAGVLDKHTEVQEEHLGKCSESNEGSTGFAYHHRWEAA